jgi:membrane peptidoglycan carboxypeptidase
VLKLIGVMFVAAILCAGVLLPYVGGIGLIAKSESDRFLNTTCDLQEAAPPEGTTFYASDGKTVLATIFEQNRKPVPLSQIPKFLQTALIDTEDRRFYSHHGVDVRGLIRSAFNTSGGDTQGGSTLTMQYVKQSRYYRDIGDFAKQQQDVSQTISRKLQDAKCAIDLEKRESKDTILDNYFNIAFFGENAYSVESAAETYFGTPTDGSTAVSHLTPPQSALLVGVLRAPTDYDPFQHPQAARERRDQVLENMVTAGSLTEAQAKIYEATPISLSTPTPPNVEQDCYNTPTSIANVGFFCDYVKSWLENTEGIKEQDIKTGGLKVVTTLNPALQNSAQAALSAKFPDTSATTALMPVVDPATGNVLAMVSSKEYGNENDNKHRADAIFTDYNARGASTYKYFTMVAALEAGVPPSLQISNNTAPKYLSYQTQRCLAPFTANNGDQNIAYAQTETMQSAIAKSSNTYFVGLEDSLFGCDLKPILTTMQNLGMKNMLQKDPSVASGKSTYADSVIRDDQSTLTLGDFPTSPLELTSAYATAANDGVYCPPAPVTAITDKNGVSIAVKRTPCSQQMTPQVARTAVSLLTGDSLPGGTSGKVFAGANWYGANKSLIAGKTGTDVVQPDPKNPAEVNTSFWFVGMTPNLVATMAMINVSNPEAPITGIPGVPDKTAQTTADASIAAQYWLSTLGPTIKSTKWTWPSANGVAGSVQVPNVVGQTPQVAEQMLSQRGFKAVAFSNGLDCGAPALPGTVGYYGPTFAAPGTTITYCISSGIKPYTIPPPPPKPTPTPGATVTPGATISPPGGH